MDAFGLAVAFSRRAPAVRPTVHRASVTSPVQERSPRGQAGSSHEEFPAKFDKVDRLVLFADSSSGWPGFEIFSFGPSWLGEGGRNESLRGPHGRRRRLLVMSTCPEKPTRSPARPGTKAVNRPRRVQRRLPAAGRTSCQGRCGFAGRPYNSARRPGASVEIGFPGLGLQEICRSGGIGRRAGFKIPWGQPREGSSPSSGRPDQRADAGRAMAATIAGLISSRRRRARRQHEIAPDASRCGTARRVSATE